LGKEVRLALLIQLSIRNFAILKHLDLEFGPHLNVLTGETGAGKSIALDALQAALGERLSTDVLAPGASKAFVEAAFDLSAAPAVAHLAAELGYPPEDDLLVLAREISPGQTRCRLNGRLVPLAVLAEVGEGLVDFHGQHDHQSLLRPASHLLYLERLLPPEDLAVRDAYRNAFERLSQVRRRLSDLRRSEREALKRRDMLTFQLQEIEAADLKPGEDEALKSRRERLRHFEKLQSALHQALLLLEGADELPGALSQLEDASAEIARVRQWDEALAPVADLLETASVHASEALHELSAYADDLDYDPAELERLESRLVLLERLEQKYGDTLEDVLAYAEQARRELDSLEQRQDQLANSSKPSNSLLRKSLRFPRSFQPPSPRPLPASKTR